MIEVSNIVKRYGDHLAVDHLSFHVEKGQIYGFLGPNGAGKSTTMNIITGYLASNEGTVMINGHDILEEPEEAKKCVGYLPEQPPLYMDMTVWEALKFVAGLKAVQKNEQEEMIEDILQMLDIKDVKDRLIKNLSKGYKQRVGLAQALIGNPEILILDEPTVGLDPKQIIEIRSLIKELSKEHTIILSSHILSEVSAICDQIMIISHGRLVACDTPEKLSRNMAGAVTLELMVQDKENRVEELLKEHFGGRVSVAGKESLEEAKADRKIWSGSLTVEDGTDIREELFYLLADTKCPILEMKQSKLSLEDIFLELTEENDDVTAGEEVFPTESIKLEENSHTEEPMSEEMEVNGNDSNL